VKINETIIINIIIIIFTLAFQRVMSSFDVAKDIAVIQEKILNIDGRVKSLEKRL
jgi:hypothetical protein